VQGINSGIAIPAHQQHGGILRTGLHILVRRIGGKILELRRVVGRAVFGYPILGIDILG
jgi:hypothetical protein